jgi:hypothetical protein
MISDSLAAGTIVTFYSWKGGVGRTMALANIAVQLARMGSSVLMVDWDLEAPGLDRYFTNFKDGSQAKIGSHMAANSNGLMGLLVQGFTRGDAVVREEEWRSKLVRLRVPQTEPTASVPAPPQANRLDFLPSGYGSDDYAKTLAEFSWSLFFAEAKGGEWLEALRDQWTDAYDFVLIDSRTGLTDSGGVCTIQMPHMLALVFTANDQSLDGGLRVVAAAQRERRNFGFDRGPLAVIPILSRWEGESEVDIGRQWMNRFDVELAPLTASWLPKDFSPQQFLEKTRVPHVPRFTFGEPLPVVTHSVTDPGLPGLYYDMIARLIRSQLSDAGRIVDPDYTKNKTATGEASIQVSQHFIRREGVSSLADFPEIVGFFTYSREDDEYSYGTLSHLRELIQRELRAQLGRSAKTFRLWQDKEVILPGRLWEDEIASALAQSIFYIPIITPTVIRSPYCRQELQSFLQREATLGRNDLVFPILYINVPEFADTRSRADPAISILANRQYADWRELRLQDINSLDVRRAVDQFCRHICDALRRPWQFPDDLKLPKEGVRPRDADV